MSQINTIPTALSTMISQAAGKIAGAAWDDAAETDLVARLKGVCAAPKLGTDGDLIAVECDALMMLAGLAEGERFTLHDYKTGDMIRQATAMEVCRGAVAQADDGGAGAFTAEVDGVETTCYVA